MKFHQGDTVYDRLNNRTGTVEKVSRKGDITVGWHSGMTERSVVQEWELEFGDSR